MTMDELVNPQSLGMCSFLPSVDSSYQALQTIHFLSSFANRFTPYS